MNRFPTFLFIAGFAIIAMIGIALLPILPYATRSVEARADGAALLFDAKSLNAISDADGFPVTPAPGPRGDQSGPRLASFSVLEPNARNSKGARLVFGPKTIDILGTGALVVRLSARGFDDNPATGFAVGIVRQDGVQWTQASLDPTGNAVEFSFPASDKPATGLAIWPAVNGEGRGFELQSIAVFRGFSEATP